MALNLFQAKMLARGLSFEISSGMKMSSRVNTLALAKQLTGVKGNKVKVLAALNKLIADTEAAGMVATLNGPAIGPDAPKAEEKGCDPGECGDCDPGECAK